MELPLLEKKMAVLMGVHVRERERDMTAGAWREWGTIWKRSLSNKPTSLMVAVVQWWCTCLCVCVCVCACVRVHM